MYLNPPLRIYQAEERKQENGLRKLKKNYYTAWLVGNTRDETLILEGLEMVRGRSWSYWFWKLANDLSKPPREKLMRCSRHNWVLKVKDERIHKETYKCSGCGQVRVKYN